MLGDSARSEYAVEQLVGGLAKRVRQPDESRQSDLANATFDPRDLNNCEVRLVGQVFLRPIPSKSSGAYVLAESFRYLVAHHPAMLPLLGQSV